MFLSFGDSEPAVQTGMDTNTLTRTLREFEPFDRLPDDELTVVVTRARVEGAKKGNQLFDVGDDDPWVFCLLEGSLDLISGDGRKIRIDAGTERARRPIAQLKPRKYSAITTSPVTLLRIDCSGFGEIAYALPTEDDFTVLEVESTCADPLHDVHCQHLLSGKLSLPSLPDIAVRTCRLVDQGEAGSDQVAKAVSSDQVISAKLMKVANSPLFYGQSTIANIERAVVRLGLSATRQLVVSFSLHELFQTSSSMLEQKMHALWEHSVEVAAICAVLSSGLKRFNPDEAQLAGLLHDISIVPILSYAEDHPDLLHNPEALDRLIAESRAPVGKRLMESWNFPQHFLASVVEAEDWWRDPSPEPDLADLVIMGQLISFLGKSRLPDVPNMSRLPAFQKISGGRLTPESLLALIDSAEEQTEEIRAVFQF